MTTPLEVLKASLARAVAEKRGAKLNAFELRMLATLIEQKAERKPWWRIWGKR